MYLKCLTFHLIFIPILLIETSNADEIIDFELDENQNLDIFCNNNQRVPKWLKDYQEEITETNTKYKIFRENNTLRILNPKKSENEADYTCVFPSNNVTVRVRAKPEFNSIKSPDHPRDVESFNVFENDNLHLVCEVFLRPQIRRDVVDFTWFRQFSDGSNELISGYNITNDSSVDERSGFELRRSTLALSNLRSADRAVYVCEAANGAIKSNLTVTVRVKDRLDALWPFLGIVAEVIALGAVILIYEKRRNKNELDESDSSSKSANQSKNPSPR